MEDTTIIKIQVPTSELDRVAGSLGWKKQIPADPTKPDSILVDNPISNTDGILIGLKELLAKQGKSFDEIEAKKAAEANIVIPDPVNTTVTIEE